MTSFRTTGGASRRVVLSALGLIATAGLLATAPALAQSGYP